MRTKFLPLLALVLCMSALFLPVTAFAASDSTPPTIDAWLEGDILHAEAFDRDSGVEAVYIDGHRIGYLVDGAVEVGLAGYAGDGEFITVYALDFAGNKSDEVKLNNPHYTAPTPTSTPQGTTPAPTPSQPVTPPAASGSSTSRPPSTSQPPSTSTPAPSASSQPDSGTESAIPDDSGPIPFTPDGTGTVQDNATDGDGKEFFTIITDDENVFYLIIDRQRDNENVYLLNTVTEEDLMALADKSGGNSGESAIPAPQPEPTPDPAPDPAPDPQPEPEQPAETGTGTIIFIVIAVLAAGGAGYYFKILRPRQQAELDGEDEDDPDEYGEDYDDDEYDFSDEAEFLDADPDDVTDKEVGSDETE